MTLEFARKRQVPPGDLNAYLKCLIYREFVSRSPVNSPALAIHRASSAAGGCRDCSPLVVGSAAFSRRRGWAGLDSVAPEA